LEKSWEMRWVSFSDGAAAERHSVRTTATAVQLATVLEAEADGRTAVAGDQTDCFTALVLAAKADVVATHESRWQRAEEEREAAILRGEMTREARARGLLVAKEEEGFQALAAKCDELGAAIAKKESEMPYLGIEISEGLKTLGGSVGKKLLQELNDHGVKVVTAAGPAAVVGMQSGDIILSINGQLVDSLDDFRAQAKGLKLEDQAVFNITRQGLNLTLTISPTAKARASWHPGERHTEKVRVNSGQFLPVHLGGLGSPSGKLGVVTHFNRPDICTPRRQILGDRSAAFVPLTTPRSARNHPPTPRNPAATPRLNARNSAPPPGPLADPPDAPRTTPTSVSSGFSSQ
jgi:hypothetical protein